MSFEADPYAIFQEDLRPGERLVWTGQPNPDRLLSLGDIMMIPFSLMWGGFAFFWEASVLSIYFKPGSNMPIVMPLFGIPFCLIGFWLIFGRFFTMRAMRKRTFYALTDQRALFLTVGRQRNLQYVTIDSQLNYQKSVRADGSGSLMFASSQVPMWLTSFAAHQPGNTQAPAFTEIKDVDDVARLLDQQLAALPKESHGSVATGS